MWVTISFKSSSMALQMNKEDPSYLINWESVVKDSKTLNYKKRRKMIKKNKRKAKRCAVALESQTNELDSNDVTCEEPFEEESKVKPLDPFAVGHFMDQVRTLLSAEKSGFEKTQQVSSRLSNSEENKTTSSAHENGIVVCNNEPQPNDDDMENGKCVESNSVKESEKESRDDEITALLSTLDAEVQEWHNPYVDTQDETPSEGIVQSKSPTLPSPVRLPETQTVTNNLDDKKKERCFFYDTMGCCRFGDSCTRRHKTSHRSTTILIPGMFKTFGLDMAHRAKRGGGTTGDVHDLGLEYSDDDMYDSFLEFSRDVLKELKKYGKIFQFKVCCNRTKHLQGNVYVEYDRKHEAKVAFKKLNNRFYDGKMLQCKYVKIRSWKKAICGMHYRRGNCSHGDVCNFLHVFKDKSREFYWADRDRY